MDAALIEAIGTWIVMPICGVFCAWAFFHYVSK